MRDGCCLFKSRRYGFQIVGANLNRYVLVNQLNCQYKAQAVSFSHKHSLQASHRPRSNPHCLADNKFAIGFQGFVLNSGAQQFDCGIWNRHMLTAATHNADDAGRLKNSTPLPVVDMNKQITGKQRQGGADALPVFPDPDCLVGGQERLDLTQGEVSDDRLFVLRKSKNGVPIAVAGL